MNVCPDSVFSVMIEAHNAARAAAREYFDKELGGKDAMPCGFAWVNIHGVRKNSKVGKALAEFNADGGRWWNPSKFPCQNVNAVRAGADAAAAVLKKHGFTAYAESRWD
jgi:hypothetical protein